MPPKKEEIQIAIPKVKIPDVKIDINSDVKKLKLGFNVKQEVMKSLPYSTTYQRLNNARGLLNYDASWWSTSGERKQINQILEDCLKLLDEFYSGKTRETANKMDANQFAAGTDKIKAIFSTINSKLDKAIEAYNKHLKENDPDYPENGEYQLIKPSDKYIYRYIALDELKEISQICKVSSQDNTINLVGTGLKSGAIKQVSVDDIFTGRQAAIRNFKNKTIHSSAKHTVIDKIPVAIDILKQYSEIGNKAATDLYNKIKNIDLTVYAKAKDGKYPILTKEDIEQLKKIQATIKEGVKAFLDKVKGTTEDTINQQLIPETASLDGIYTEDAIRYRKNLQTVVGEIDEIADEMKASLEKAEKHPELFTLPIVFKGPGSDEFLGDTSFYLLSVKLSELKTSVSANNDSFQKLVEANSNISFVLREFDSFVNSLYEIGEDGTYKPTPVASIDEFQRQIAEVEKVIRDNENNFIDNLSALKKDEAKKIFSSMKNILKDYKAGAEKTKKECEKLAEGTFDRNNVFIVANIHPDQNVRKQLNKARQDRIDAAHDEAERIANSNFDGRNMDAETILRKRLEMIKNNRHFSVVENKNACEKFFSKYEEMLGFLGELYARDNNGGFTHFANDEERAKLEKLFVEVRAEIKDIPKYLPKKEYDNTLKSLFSSIENEIQSFEDAIQGAQIYGTYPIADFLDAGKFGNPSLYDTRIAAYGYDRYDWNVNREKNDQEWVSYEYYKNPVKKITADASKLYNASLNADYHYTDAEKKWIKEINDIVSGYFNKDFETKYFTMVTKHDPRLDTNVEHYPLMEKSEQDQLRAKFHEINEKLQEIGASEEFKNSQNRTLRSFLNGLATYTQQTEHRLRTFHSDLDMPLYTIQEATSGRVDTSDYNFRNDPETFKRIFDSQKTTEEKEREFNKKLQDAGLLLTDEQLYEIQPDNNGKRVRKKEVDDKEGTFAKIYTKLFNRKYERSWEYVTDINDFFKVLEKVKNFENKYFQCLEDGEYMELPITLAEIPAEGFDGPIKTYEQLKYCYVQLQYMGYKLKDKFDKYNEKNNKNPLPNSLGDALHKVHGKALVLQTIISLEDAHRTKPKFMNVMELIHSDPDKRKNMWTIRQHRTFYNHRQEKGQFGTYRNLQHFEMEYNSEMSFNGRFYDISETPVKGEALEVYLSKILGKYDAEASQAAKDFALKLVEAAAKDPDKASEFIPTTEELDAENVTYSAILNKATSELHLGQCDWASAKDREMIRNVIRDIAAIGIDKYDHEQRQLRGAKYGENLLKHYELISKMSEELGFDPRTAPPYQRVIPKTAPMDFTVPGDNPPKKYTGMMVEAAPDRLGHITGWDKYNNKEQQVAVNVITGKDLIESKDPGLVSIDGFNNNPNLIKALAGLQAICFLCNAPMPKFEDLKFAVIPGRDGVKEVHLMSHMPEPAFLEADDFEGKINLEDMLVLPGNIGHAVKNLLSGNKKDPKRALQAFANQFTSELFPAGSEAKARIDKIIMKKAEEMSKYLNDKELCKDGMLTSGQEDGYLNGIRKDRILITDDFKSLRMDKLSLKPTIFGNIDNLDDEKRTNIFTAFTNLPEKVYHNIRKDPSMNDEKPEMKKAFITRYNNGVKRIAHSLNLEDTLAECFDYHDEYKWHSIISHDSKEFKDMRDALKAISDFEKTGIVKYKDDQNQDKEMNIYNIDIAGANGYQRIPDNAIEAVTRMFGNAQTMVNRYIDAKTGKLFNPITDLGSRRYEAAREISEKLQVATTMIVKLGNPDPVKSAYGEFDKAPERKVKTRINVNNLAIEENENAPQENNRVKDSAAKDANKAKGKVDDKKKDEKGKGGKNK